MVHAAKIESGLLIMIYCIVINEQLSSTMQGEQNAKSIETNDEWKESAKEIGALRSAVHTMPSAGCASRGILARSGSPGPCASSRVLVVHSAPLAKLASGEQELDPFSLARGT
jgi:hypothetical protein